MIFLVCKDAPPLAVWIGCVGVVAISAERETLFSTSASSRWCCCGGWCNAGIEYNRGKTFEARRQYQLFRTYWLNVLASQVLFTFVFLLLAGLSNVVVGGQFDRQAQLTLLVGFLTWRITTGYMEGLVESISADARWGTLEQIWISGRSLSQLLIARTVVLFGYFSLRVLLIGVVVIPLLRLPLYWRLDVLPIILLTFTNIVGIALLLLACQLVYKQIAFLANPIGFLLFFLTGAFFPFEQGSTLNLIGRFLPLTDGIHLLRVMLIHNTPLPSLYWTPTFWLFLLNTIVYLLLGYGALTWARQRTLQEGSLAHY